MNPSKIDKLRKRLAVLRHSPQKARALEAFAKQLGRSRIDRGKEPVWKSNFSNLRVVSIPHHGGKDIPLGTKKSILAQLEEDLDAWEERVAQGDN